MLIETNTIGRFAPGSDTSRLEPREPLLRRDAAAQYLRSRYSFGSKSWLAKAAVTGNGPRFYKRGARIVLYDPRDLDAWAAEALGEPRCSTSTSDTDGQ